ncbi:hypothetical protein JRI60_15160 [Archangium violaceum]|uniref:hypothetical protein n=1 Tax=Archangium violaceum TaxID=83451 RepID=UPI0019500051|nr:hypothetical protein [Archangium violaceum]QRO00261.1 hypothetical protein JRI60_15160 [Archangium violaceum]
MKNPFKKSLLLAGVSLLLAACGGTEAEPTRGELETQQSGLLAACTETEELTEVVEHACIHAELGPFQNLTAAALGTVPFVDVNLPHTGYVITLPANSSSCGWGGSVNFIPEESGEFAFLLSRYPGLRIFNGTTEVGLECRFQVPTEVCGALRNAIIADLEAGVEYRLEFQTLKQSNAQFTLVVEEAAHHDHQE